MRWQPGWLSEGRIQPEGSTRAADGTGDLARTVLLCSPMLSENWPRFIGMTAEWVPATAVGLVNAGGGNADREDDAAFVRRSDINIAAHLQDGPIGSAQTE